MPNSIILKDKNATEATYTPVNSIKVPSSVVGEYIKYRNVPGTYFVQLVIDGVLAAMAAIPQGKDMSNPYNPVKSGYIFAGWATTSGATVPDVTFPRTIDADTTFYAVFNTVIEYKASPTGYGNQTPTTSFSTNSNLANWSVADHTITKDGSTFIKFPTFYRKIVGSPTDQITSFVISSWKEYDDFKPYPCFVDESGNILPYILIGQYCTTSSSVANSVSGSAVSMTPSAGRTLCRNKGTGYQMYDWQMHRLWQDLICAKMQTVNINSGSGIGQDGLGIWHEQGGYKVYPWIDGTNIITASKKWAFSRYPSKYVNGATGATDGYQESSYTYSGTSGNNITSLGYDTTDEYSKFFNFPMTASGTSYTIYYCDAFYFGTSNKTYPVRSLVGNANADCGAFDCSASNSWEDSNQVRLCYRPLAS